MRSDAVRWSELAERSLAGEIPGREEVREVLRAGPGEIPALLEAAFRVRRAHHGLRVQIHVLHNAKLGACPEDCSFCSQSSRHGSPSGEAPIESVEVLVEGARDAARASARRYCMVTATRGPSQRDLDVVCEAARRIKAELEIDLCASLGLLTPEKARRLAEAGVDRINHNLETGPAHFEKVVTTHRYEDRVQTVKHARAAGMEICCGGIVGLGETEDDLLDLAFALRELEVDSVPVNFLDPRPGTPLAPRARPEPTYALKVLCGFRFLHPRADLRVAGGREVTLRSLQPLALYPANSIFTSGYLTTGGNQADADHQMIRDLGFEIEVTRREAPEPESHDGQDQQGLHQVG
jgi:biotin synthase